MEKNYTLFDKNDFLEDEFFAACVKHRDPAAMAFWEAWKGSGPGNLREYEAAETMLRHILSAGRFLPGRETADRLWRNIEARLPHAQELQQRRTGRIRAYRLAAAAAALLLLATGALYFLLRLSGMHMVAAPYGHLRQVMLQDSSVVTLNSNSTLRYARHWWPGSKREVWLEGEGHFDVNHLKHDLLPVKPGERFVVHAGPLDIEVLGTAFNVKDRRGATRVALERGRVRITSSVTADTLLMLPGEQVIFDHQTNRFTREKTNAAAKSGWMEQQLFLESTSVHEIIWYLEDTYGYKVMLADPAIANRKLNGTIPLGKEENIFFMLSNILSINIEKKDSLLIFKPVP